LCSDFGFGGSHSWLGNWHNPWSRWWGSNVVIFTRISIPFALAEGSCSCLEWASIRHMAICIRVSTSTGNCCGFPTAEGKCQLHFWLTNPLFLIPWLEKKNVLLGLYLRDRPENVGYFLKGILPR
jgi:hypothetical protein